MEHSGVGPLVPALRLLHDRGHTIHLAARRVKTGHSHEELEALAADCARITYGPLAPGGGSWSRLARSLRFGIDYLRYLEPRYRDATKLRARAEGRAPAAVRRVGGIASRVGAPAVVALRRSLQLAERSIPPPRSHLRYLAEFEPDVVLITPLVDLGSRQSDWLRAAKRLGIRTVYPVFSWDNLTNKGLLRDIPDRVLVWNDLQRREAAELHRVPADRIRLTGAPVCDPWFEWRPSRSREEFCREVGLRADRPIVLYVCSSPFVAPGEPEFLRTWVERLRSHGDVLAEAGILIRPYPDTAGRWRDAAPEDPQVRVWPRSGEAPHDEVSRRNFFDSIFHAAAVVGINTTAQIESAIVGRPVHTVLAEEFRETQQGTLHFHYLKADEFGLLFVGRDFEEHVAQLAESVRGRVDDGRNERFVRRFVRPLGLDRPAAEVLADEVEDVGRRPAPAPDRGPVLAPVFRAALAPFAERAGRGADSGARDRQRSPVADLRRTVERLRRKHRTGPLVALPWLDDELGELLYWIPFLRWAQSSSIGIRERLAVVCRASSASWYQGIGTSLAVLDAEARPPLADLVADRLGIDLDRSEVLRPELVGAAREELAAHDPSRRIQHRLVEFAQLRPSDPSVDLPEPFLALALDERSAALGEALAARSETVSLGDHERAEQAGVLGRARGFVGGFGPEAVLASLVGTPAVVLRSDAAEPADLRIVSSFLGRPPFGPIHLIDDSGGPASVADRALAWLDAQHAALAIAP